MTLTSAFAQRGRQRYNDLGRYSADGSYRDGYGTMATQLEFTWSDTGWGATTWTFSSGTVDVSINGVAYGSMTTATVFYINATRSDTVIITPSDPTAVTIIDLRGCPMQGSASQFEQFTALQELYYPTTDPLASFVTDTQSLTNADFGTGDLTGWTSSGNFAVSGTSLVCTADGGSYNLNQDIGASVGDIYTFSYYVSQNSFAGYDGLRLLSSGMFDINLNLSGDIGYHEYTLWSTQVSAQDIRITILGASTSGTLTVEWFSVKAITNQVTNGGMDADSDWTKQNGNVTIGSGVATWTAGGATLLQDVSSGVSSGSPFRLTYTATRSAGTFTPDLRGTAAPTIAASGSYLSYLTAGTDDVNLTFTGDASFAGTLDNALNVAWPAQPTLGNISSLVTATTTVLNIDAASQVAWEANALDGVVGLKTFTIDAMNWTVDEVNASLVSLYVADLAGMTGCTITYTNVPAPTGAGATAAANLAVDNTVSVP